MSVETKAEFSTPPVERTVVLTLSESDARALTSLCAHHIAGAGSAPFGRISGALHLLFGGYGTHLNAKTRDYGAVLLIEK